MMTLNFTRIRRCRSGGDVRRYSRVRWDHDYNIMAPQNNESGLHFLSAALQLSILEDNVHNRHVPSVVMCVRPLKALGLYKKYRVCLQKYNSNINLSNFQIYIQLHIRLLQYNCPCISARIQRLQYDGSNMTAPMRRLQCDGSNTTAPIRRLQ